MPLILVESLRIERIKITITDLPNHLVGTKLVQLSDLHYDGTRLSPQLLDQAIALSNQEQPDLVLITGDFVTDKPEPIPDLTQKLQELQSKAGIFGCLGNHDSPKSVKQFLIDSLDKVGIKILVNEVAYPLGTDLALAGLADFWSRDFQPREVFAQINPDIPRLILSHNPDSAKVLAKYRVDLQLSGHSHGGQVVVPGYGALPAVLRQIRKHTPKAVSNYIPYLKECADVVQNWEWSEGWHPVKKNQLYVNRGLGTYFPGRWNCPPELTVIKLEN